MVVAAGLRSERLDLDAFLRQANDYAEWDSGWDKMTRFMTELSLSHAFPVRRVAEVTAWVQSGEFDRIMGGQYTRRDEKIDPRGEAGDAVQFYTERFRALFREAGDGVAGAGERVSEWLRGVPKTDS
jgi:hypothetical protein